jgi:biopolymer transport protein ExbD
MKLQSRSKEEPEVNLTSLIDVVLLLLVFFMVSTSFVREAEINLRLPEASASAEPSAAATETLEITISQTGEFTVNGRPLVNNERRTLRAAIERLIGDRRDMPVLEGVSPRHRVEPRFVHGASCLRHDLFGAAGAS